MINSSHDKAFGMTLLTAFGVALIAICINYPPFFIFLMGLTIIIGMIIFIYWGWFKFFEWRNKVKKVKS